MANALEGFKHRGEGIPLIGMAFDGNQNIEGAVMINDAHVFDSRVVRSQSIAVVLAANND